MSILTPTVVGQCCPTRVGASKEDWNSNGVAPAMSARFVLDCQLTVCTADLHSQAVAINAAARDEGMSRQERRHDWK